MITPYEIENKDFSKSMRGYNTEEVDNFLDQIIIDLQALLDENEKLKTSVDDLEKELSQYRRSETSVLNTLESAKKLMNDISESAEKRAEIIIRNAQMEASSIQRDAKESISKLSEEGERLKYKVSKFRERYRQLLEDQLNQLEGSTEELFEDLEQEFMPASMESRRTGNIQSPVTEPDHSAFEKDFSDFSREPLKPAAADETVVRKPSSTDTLVVSDKSLEDMLMENYGVKNPDPAKDQNSGGEDLSKTRIMK